MPDHLILQLEAPLMSFGDTMIDATGPTRDLPILSAVTGLIANAELAKSMLMTMAAPLYLHTLRYAGQ